MKPYVCHTNHLDEYEAAGPVTRFARLLIDPDVIAGAKLGIALFRYEPEQIGPSHCHAEEAEVYYVLEGEGTLQLGDAIVELREGVTVYIPPGVEHETKNTGGGELKFLGIFSPAISFDNIKTQWTRGLPRRITGAVRPKANR